MPKRRILNLDLLSVTAHAEDRMLAHDVHADDLRAVYRDDPILISQKPKVEWREGSGRGIRPRRLKVIGRDARHRLLTLIIEAPDNRGAARLVTVFPTDNDDEINRYWQSR